MIREPWFWREKTIAARAAALSLSPLGGAYNAIQKTCWRMTRATPAPLPVICIGNASVGGVGKTPFAIMAQQSLQSQHVSAHFLTRGYGGRMAGPVRVDTAVHAAYDVGDEALLLAGHAPCWVARNRAAGAAKAAAESADAVIMDDGFQNPGLEKTFSFLLVPNDARSQDARVFPAGPMREPLRQALQRADCAVVVKNAQDEATDASLAEAIGGGPTLSCWLKPELSDAPERVVAFCGIGAPEKFFATLNKAEVSTAERFSFPDHHFYTAGELTRLRQIAKKENATLITTQKDYCRLSAEDRADIAFLPVRMATDDPEALAACMLEAIEKWRRAHDGAA